MTAPETPAETETRVEAEKIDRIVGAAEPVGWVHPKWRDRLDYVLVAAVVVLAVGLGVLWAVATQAKKESDSNASRVGKVTSALDAANAQILRLGGTPVKPPVSPPVVDKGITDGQILDAVAAYFASHPVASPTIDYSLLHAYVVDYMVAHPAHSGKPGKPGPSGFPGQDGTGVSAGEISAAVADYFQVNPPEAGPPGPTGPEGPSGSSVTGPPGRGISSVSCESSLHLENFTFTITFSDGSSQIVTCDQATPSPTP